MDPNYGQRIKKVRKAKRLTQVQLAKAAGIGIASLQRYEASERQPTMDVLEKIAAAFGMNMGEFIWADDATKEAGESRWLKVRKSDETELLMDLEEDFSKLNFAGKIEAAKRVNELTQIEKYTKLEE